MQECAVALQEVQTIASFVVQGLVAPQLTSGQASGDFARQATAAQNLRDDNHTHASVSIDRGRMTMQENCMQHTSITSATGRPCDAMMSRGNAWIGERSRLVLIHLTIKARLDSDTRGLGCMGVHTSATAAASLGGGAAAAAARCDDGLEPADGGALRVGDAAPGSARNWIHGPAHMIDSHSTVYINGGSHQRHQHRHANS